MALDFPNPATQTPVNEFSPTSTPSATTNGVTYTWDGTKWVGAAGGGSGADLQSVTDNGNTTTNDIITTGDVDADNVVASGDVQATSFNGGPLAGFRNQIINGDFRVWQRGTGPFNNTAAAAYTADRWMVAIGANGMQRSNNAPSGFVHSMSLPAGAILQQGIELDLAGGNGAFAVGSTWTLSIWSTQTPASNAEFVFRDQVGSGINQVNAGPSTAWVNTGETDNGFTRFIATVTLTGSASATNICLELQIFGGTAATEITGIQLEPGPVATPFEHRPIGSELALCQRYCVVTQASTVSLISASNTDGVAAYSFPVEMRANPTVYKGDGGAVNTTALIQYSSGANYGTLSTMGVTKFGTHYCSFSRVVSEPLARIDSLRFDAEL